MSRPAVPPAPQRPAAVSLRPARPLTAAAPAPPAGSRVGRRWRVARAAALPLAMTLSAGLTGCGTPAGPLDAMAGARLSALAKMEEVKQAALGPLRRGAEAGGAEEEVRPVADPFLAAESAALADAADAPADLPAATSPAADGMPQFAEDFDASLAVLRDEAEPFPAAADAVTLAGADDSAPPLFEGEDPFGDAMEELAEAPVAPAELSDAPAGPSDLFEDGPVGPADLFADAAADPAEVPKSLGQAFADSAPAPEDGADAAPADVPPPAAAAPTPPALAAVDPFPAPPAAGPLAAEVAAAEPGAGTVSANAGTAPAPVPVDPFAGAPRPGAEVTSVGPAPELSFGRPPLPPRPTDGTAGFAGAETVTAADDPAELALAALAAPGPGMSTGLSPSGPSLGGIAAPEPVPAGPQVPALAAAEPAAASAARTAPTMPASQAAGVPAAAVADPASVPADGRIDLAGDPFSPPSADSTSSRRLAARPVGRTDPRAAGAVELSAPRMDPPAAGETASPAAPLAAGLGLGSFLLVGLGLWRRRGGLF